MSISAEKLKLFSKTKVLVIGDIMLDRFEYGKVERISPEAPVPVFKYQREKTMLGGAGNVVANLRTLGCQTSFLGMVGDDENGHLLEMLLEKTGATSSMLYRQDMPTTIKTRLIAGNNHLLRSDIENPSPMSEENLQEFMGLVKKHVADANIVLLSDYAKGLFSHAVTQAIIEYCNEIKIPVIIDPKGSDYSKYAGAYLVKPNLKEFSEATGRQYFPQNQDFKKAACEGATCLFDKFGIRNILVTLSEHGMIFIPSDDNNGMFQIATVAREVFDVSGAGDTSLATLGAALGSGFSIPHAIELANIASGIVVGKLGTATVTCEELTSALLMCQTDYDTSITRKILTAEQAKKRIAEFHANSKTVGYIHGCFDCCNYGHLHTLSEAKHHCDVLVVGLDTPLNCSLLQDEKTRLTLLSSLDYVDVVLMTSDLTENAQLELLMPDFIVKTEQDSPAETDVCKTFSAPYLNEYPGVKR